MLETPYFPTFRPKVAALGRRVVQSLRQRTLAQLDERLSSLLPNHLLASEDEGPHSRNRIYTLRLTLECFLWQVLNPATACREVVRQVQALCRLCARPVADENTSAYIQARKALPLERFTRLLESTAQLADPRVGQGAHLAGRPVIVADGSTTQLADTARNQRVYPQPSTQKRGCGFPVMKFVALFSLASGSVMNVIQGTLKDSDLRLFRTLWEALKSGDIFLADRAWGEYATLAGLPQQGVDVVARLNQRRKVDFRRGKLLGKSDALFTWRKSPQRSVLFTPEQWAQLPKEITVRIIRFNAVVRGFRSKSMTVVTTLLDPKVYPAKDLVALYGRRWRMELCFRDLKTTMGMESLRCKSPEMARKELLAYMIAHNLVRCVMAEAAEIYQVDLERISFKGTVDGIRQYSAAIDRARNKKQRLQLWDDLLVNLVRDLVPYRPNRQEPRAVKRRPKAYPLLNKPRKKFKEIPHRSKYRKSPSKKSSA